MQQEYRVEFLGDPVEFLDRAAGWMGVRPVVSTVVATTTLRLAEHGGLSELPHAWWAIVTGPMGETAGLAMRTAAYEPHPPYLLPMPDAAAAAVAEALLERGERVDGLAGARAAVDAAAAVLAQRSGRVAAVELHQRLLELGDLCEPPAVAGRLRGATCADAALAHRWIVDFLTAADGQAGRPPTFSRRAGGLRRTEVERRIRRGMLSFWIDEHGAPVSLVGVNPPAYGAARIGPVYTPDALRGRGYAGAAVAAVCRRLRTAEQQPVLFADSANPASTALYARLGFRPVVDTVDVVLRASAA
jgi:hypothetical protein